MSEGDKIVDFKTVRMNKETNPNHRVFDNGEWWYEADATYVFDDGKNDKASPKFHFTFYARDEEDAIQRVEAMKKTLVYSGMILNSYTQDEPLEE